MSLSSLIEEHMTRSQVRKINKMKLDNARYRGNLKVKDCNLYIVY